MTQLWVALRANVQAYFVKRPMLGPGLVAEFTVTIDDQYYVRMYDWNHGGLSDGLIIQAMVDAFITNIQKKGGEKKSVFKYMEQRWEKNVKEGR